jgi:hypothetical protein
VVVGFTPPNASPESGPAASVGFVARAPTDHRSRFVVIVLTVFGLYSVLLGLFMLLAPEAFFDSLGAFGARNNHYIFDNASFELPLGLLLLAAIRWPSWRLPALSFATAHWVLHTVSHLIDTDHAAGRTVGLIEAAGLALGTLWLAVSLWFTIRAAGAPSQKEN